MQEIDIVLPYTVHNFRAREHVWVFIHVSSHVCIGPGSAVVQTKIIR